MLVWAVGLLAAAPILVSTMRAVAAGWIPVWDNAIITTNALDAVSGDSRLVGVYSDASLSSVGPIYNAGPVPLWVFTLPTHLLGDWAIPATVGAINTASVMGVVALARRRGGRALMFATAMAVAIMCRSLPSEALHDVFNPSLALLPLALLAFLAWAVACGEHRLLPVMVLVASFTMQAHVSVAVASLGMLLFGLVGYATWARRSRGRVATSDERRGRWMLAALLVAVACWSAPVLYEAVHRPGNAVRVARTASVDQATAGTVAGWHALVQAIGVVPWWLRTPPGPVQRIHQVFGAPTTFQTATTLLVLGCLLLVALAGARKRRRDVAAGAVLALVLAAALIASVSQTPTRLALNIDKATRWASPAGMCVWLVLAWSATTLARTLSVSPGARLKPIARPGSRTATVAGICGVALAAVPAASSSAPDDWQPLYRPGSAVLSDLPAQVPRHGTVLVENRSGVLGFAIQTAIMYRLRRAGHSVVTSDLLLAQKLGPRYASSSHLPDAVLTIQQGAELPPPGARVLARASVGPGESDPVVRQLTLSIADASR